jgi:hydrogenase maturation protease
MEGLGQRLRQTLRGRVCVMGVGNVDYGDDGFGVYLAEELVAAGVPDVLIGATTPEHYLEQIAERGFDNLLIVDATDFGEDPGTVAFLNAGDIQTAFPQISTHKISLGVLAKVLEEAGTRVWLLGVQPESLASGQQMTPTMQASLEIVHELLREVRITQEKHAATRSRVEKALG